MNNGFTSHYSLTIIHSSLPPAAQSPYDQCNHCDNSDNNKDAESHTCFKNTSYHFAGAKGADEQYQ